MHGCPHANTCQVHDKVTINGLPVTVLLREKSRYAGVGYSVESLVIEGIHDFRIGTTLEISLPEEIIRGRVSSVGVANHYTSVRLYRIS